MVLFAAWLSLASAAFAQQAVQPPAVPGLIVDRADRMVPPTAAPGPSATPPAPAASANIPAACPSAVDCPITCCADIPDTFYFSADALVFDLAGPPHQLPLVLDATSGRTVLITGDLDYGLEPGPRFTFGWNLAPCHALELTYFGLHYWSAGAMVLGEANLRLPGDLALATRDFLGADVMDVETYGRIHNAEATFLHLFDATGFSLLGGLRYLNFEEHFNIASLAPDNTFGEYDLRARSEFFGGQIGARWSKAWSRFGLEVTGKTGIYGNTSRQNTFVGDVDNTVVLRHSSTKASNPAFIGELDFNAVVPITKHWTVRSGYNLVWLDGIARAADQLDFTDQAGSGTALVSGNGLLHGPHLGLEACW
jgi:hypothetical protein